MSRFAYVNGAFVRHDNACVHIEDRGFQFADSVYEVVYLYKGKLIDTEGHLARLERSLDELAMEMPKSRAALMINIKELVRRNRLHTGLVYIQVSRGSAKRDFPFPINIMPTLVMTAYRVPAFTPDNALKGIKVCSTPDTRWARCDIKTTALLAAAMAKQAALEDGFDDAWFVDEKGYVTEGTSNNAWIVRADGKLQTRKPSHEILNGITRMAILKMATNEGIEIIEDSFTLEEALNAREAFVTSASACVKPVLAIDGNKIGSGEVGPVSRKVAKIYGDFLEAQ